MHPAPAVRHRCGSAWLAAAGPRSATRAEVHGGFVWHSIPPTSLNREVRQRHPRPPAPRMDVDATVTFCWPLPRWRFRASIRPADVRDNLLACVLPASTGAGALATPQASGFRVRSPALMNNGFFPNWTQWGLNGVNRLGGISQPGASLLRPVLLDDQRCGPEAWTPSGTCWTAALSPGRAQPRTRAVPFSVPPTLTPGSNSTGHRPSPPAPHHPRRRLVFR
jgi:hypothetical protein